MRVVFTFLLMSCFALVPQALSHDLNAAGDDMARAARDFLASLDDAGRKKALFPHKSDERKNWHYIPKDRQGLTIKEMTVPQSQLAHVLLITGLSHSGYKKALTIMSLEQVLHELENNNPGRDPAKYYVSIFGEPKSGGTWGWRFEGHHLSLNFSIVEGKAVAATPAFFATNPAEILSGPRKGLRVLAAEEDLARDLVNALSGDQRKIAVFSDKAPKEILSAAERKVNLLKPTGISFADLEPGQQSTLLALVRENIERQHPVVAGEALSQLEEDGYSTLNFAWAGGLKKREPHYYRVQSKRFLIEYANTQNDSNHVHVVWRDFDGDFGDDVLRAHYEKEHK